MLNILTLLACHTKSLLVLLEIQMEGTLFYVNDQNYITG